jgi:sec-independent protein translocase protein TatA
MGTFLFISGQEIFVIMIVVLLLFGADKLPEMAKGIGKGMRDFKKATDEIRREIETSTRDIRNEMSDVQNTVQREVSDISGNIQKNINDTTDSFNSEIQEVSGEFKKHVDDISDSVNSSGFEHHDYSNPYQNPESDYSQPDFQSTGNIDESAAVTNETAEAAPQKEVVQKPKRKYKPRSKPKPESDGTQPELGIS